MSFLQAAGGVAQDLLMQSLKDGSFQNAAVGFLRGLGGLVVKHKDNPQALAEIGTLLAEHPKNTLGTIVKGTEAEKLVNPSIIVPLDHAGGSPGGAG